MGERAGILFQGKAPCYRNLFIHHIDRSAVHEGFDVVRGGLHDALAGFLGSPGNVRGDDAVLRGVDADLAETDDTCGLTGDFDHRKVPVAPVDVGCPLAGVDGIVVVADVGADLKEQADCELAHVVGAVDRDVQDRDALFLSILIIHDIVAGGKDSDSLQVRARVDGRLTDGCLFSVFRIDTCIQMRMMSDAGRSCGYGVTYPGRRSSGDPPAWI